MKTGHPSASTEQTPPPDTGPLTFEQAKMALAMMNVRGELSIEAGEKVLAILRRALLPAQPCAELVERCARAAYEAHLGKDLAAHNRWENIPSHWHEPYWRIARAVLAEARR